MVNNQLWAAIYDLYVLLAARENREEKYQDFFVRHRRVVFEALGYDRAERFDKMSIYKLPYDNDREFRPEPDFLCAQSSTEVLTVFELKTPLVRPAITNRKDGNRRKFSAEFSSHVSQATEYTESIRGREEARAIVCSALGLKTISAYRIVLVHGMSASNEASKIAQLCANNSLPIDVIHYDTLLDRLIRLHPSAGWDNSEGWTFVFHAAIARSQPQHRAYIMDVGHLDKNRASIYVENGAAFFEVLDRTGARFASSPCLFKPDHPIYIRWEFSKGANGLMIACNINNSDVDLRVGSAPLSIEIELSNFHLASSIFGAARARMAMFESYILERTMKVSDRLGSFEYFMRKIASTANCVVFDGRAALKMSSNMAQIALEQENRPVLRKWPLPDDCSAA